jgi:hypothetical protein
MGENRLTNHGPMAAEVLVRRGHEAQVHRWVDAYLRRLDELPAAITDDTWRAAPGGGSATGPSTCGQVAEAPWRDVLLTWWPRLLTWWLARPTA